jgi:hypothetical protein
VRRAPPFPGSPSSVTAPNRNGARSVRPEDDGPCYAQPRLGVPWIREGSSRPVSFCSDSGCRCRRREAVGSHDMAGNAMNRIEAESTSGWNLGHLPVARDLYGYGLGVMGPIQYCRSPHTVSVLNVTRLSALRARPRSSRFISATRGCLLPLRDRVEDPARTGGSQQHM